MATVELMKTRKQNIFSPQFVLHICSFLQTVRQRFFRWIDRVVGLDVCKVDCGVTRSEHRRHDVRQSFAREFHDQHRHLLCEHNVAVVRGGAANVAREGLANNATTTLIKFARRTQLMQQEVGSRTNITQSETMECTKKTHINIYS